MRMLGKKNKPPCGNCCGDPSHEKVRQTKRSERQQVAREIEAEKVVDNVDPSWAWDYR